MFFRTCIFDLVCPCCSLLFRIWIITSNDIPWGRERRRNARASNSFSHSVFCVLSKELESSFTNCNLLLLTFSLFTSTPFSYLICIQVHIYSSFLLKAQIPFSYDWEVFRRSITWLSIFCTFSSWVTFVLLHQELSFSAQTLKLESETLLECTSKCVGVAM